MILIKCYKICKFIYITDEEFPEAYYSAVGVM